VFYRDDFRKRRGPSAVLRRKLFILRVHAALDHGGHMDKSGDLVSIERFMRAELRARSRWSSRRAGHVHPRVRYDLVPGNDDARLVRVEYNAGNRKPMSQPRSIPESALPLRVGLSSRVRWIRRGLAAVRVDHCPQGGAVLQRLTDRTGVHIHATGHVYGSADGDRRARRVDQCGPIDIVGAISRRVWPSLSSAATRRSSSRCAVRYAVRSPIARMARCRAAASGAARHVSAQYLRTDSRGGRFHEGNPLLKGGG